MCFPLVKGKIQVARKHLMWVFKRTAFEPRSEHSKRKKDLSMLDQEIVQTPLKAVHPNIMKYTGNKWAAYKLKFTEKVLQL